eukprot:4728376-Pyramimonas_sp.AAC.1
MALHKPHWHVSPTFLARFLPPDAAAPVDGVRPSLSWPLLLPAARLAAGLTVGGGGGGAAPPMAALK